MAKGKWADILPRLNVPEELVARKNLGQPCPRCGGNDRFAFTDKFGRGDGFCRKCGHLDAYTIAEQFGTSFIQTIAHLEVSFGICRVRDVQPASPPSRPYFARIWEQATKLNWGDPVVNYLQARGLHMGSLPSSIRFHPNLVFEDEQRAEPMQRITQPIRHPALVGMICDVAGKPIGMQRIYLDGRGGKAPVDSPKKGLGKVNQGGAIRLRTHCGHLGVAEGIETAEACFALYGIPTWACVTAAGMEKFQVPLEVTQLTIFGDVDRSFTGQKSALTLAHRCYGKVDVRIQWPDIEPCEPTREIDFLDVLASIRQEGCIPNQLLNFVKNPA